MEKIWNRRRQESEANLTSFTVWHSIPPMGKGSKAEVIWEISVKGELERLIAENASLKEERDLYFLTLEALDIGITVSNDKGQWRYGNKYNRVLAGMGHLSYKEVQEKLGLFGVYENNRSISSPAEAAHLKKIYFGVMEGKKTYQFDKPWLINGQERILNSVCTPAIDDAGKVRHVVAASQDVTDIRRAEKELRDAEERWRTLIDMAADPISVYQNGAFIYVNKACVKLAGAGSEKDIIGKPALSFIHEDSRNIVLERQKKMFATGEAPPTAVEKLVRLDGEVRDIEVSIAPIMLQGSIAVQGVMRDVTERVKAERELREAKEAAELANAMKDKFVTYLAHDLRSPITSVLQALRCMAMPGFLQEENRPTVTPLIARCEEVIGLIDRLLDLNRLKSGKLDIEIDRLDARAVYESAIGMYRNKAEEKGVVLMNDVPEGIAIDADGGLFRRVIANIVHNAIKFSRRGNSVTAFLAARENGKIVFGIRDTGIGMDTSTLDSLFTSNASKIGTNREKGNGLGLAICHEIMAMHGGSISAESKPDEGCTFYLMLRVWGNKDVR